MAKKLSMPMRGQILAAAGKATMGDRDVAYGKPEDNFERIRLHINAMLINRFGPTAPTLTRADVAMIGIYFKTGRLEGNQSHHDSWVDVAGYAACGGEVSTG